MAWTDEQLLEAREIAVRSSARIVSPTLRADHEDVAHFAVVKLLEKDPASLDDWRSWVATVARRRALRLRREHGRRLRHAQSDPDTPRHRSTPSGLAVGDVVLRQLLGILTERDARLFVAAALDGASHADLAEEFGLKNANVVGVTLSRIKKQLRQSFSEPELRQMLGPLPRPYDPYLRELGDPPEPQA